MIINSDAAMSQAAIRAQAIWRELQNLRTEQERLRKRIVALLQEQQTLAVDMHMYSNGYNVRPIARYTEHDAEVLCSVVSQIQI